MRRSASGAAVVLLTGLLVGTAANLVAPRRIPWTQDWTQHLTSQAATSGLRIVELADVRNLVRDGATLIFDARPNAEYGAGHLPGALSLPVDDFDALYPQFAPLLGPSTPLLVYCSGEECDESLLLGRQLHAQGHTNILLFPGGYGAWTAAEGGAP